MQAIRDIVEDYKYSRISEREAMDRIVETLRRMDDEERESERAKIGGWPMESGPHCRPVGSP